MRLNFEFLKRIKVRIALSFSFLFLLVAVPAIIYAFSQVNIFFEGMFLQQMRVAGIAAGALASPGIDPDSLTNNISNITSTSAFLLSKNGDIISQRCEEPLADSSLLLSVPIENLNPPDKAPHRFVTIANRRYLQVEVKMSGDNRLLLVKSFSKVSMLKARMREVIFWSSFLGLLALIAVAFWVSAKITEPLEKLTDQAKKIRLGGSPEKTEIKSPDEVGELADALNDIVDNLTQAKFDLNKLEKTQRDFFGQIGERLEQPLLVIQEQLNSIIKVENSTDVEGRKRLSLALAQAKRVQEIIHTLIEISQLEYGEITLDLRPIPIKKIVDEAATRFKNEAARKGLCFKTICKPDDLTVLADEKQLQLALESLISNAIYFTAEGYVTIICQESDSMVLIRVEDSGRGIPQNQIDRIFERFYRVEPADAGNGAGLGLVLAKEIIRAHGQKLEVESRLGVGSHFSFRLPMAPFQS